MKIVYITSALKQDTYDAFNENRKMPLNPSNQNFHNKLIRSLAINNSVEVLSLRPFTKLFSNGKLMPSFVERDGNIVWNYLQIIKNPFKRGFSFQNEVLSKFSKEDLKNSVIIFDSISFPATNLAFFISKKYKIPKIGILTDNPINITGIKKPYVKFLLKKNTKLDGYISLTEPLNKLFNIRNKPVSIIEGIVEENNTTIFPGDKPYFYFGGALLKRYGVYNLIEAYKKLETLDYDLYIAGHHEIKEELECAIKDNENIKFLGSLSFKKVQQVENNAYALINPRPKDESLDLYSFPSKTLEYLASDSLVISTNNIPLRKIFEKEIIWAGNGSIDELYSALKQTILLGEKEKEEIKKSAKSKVLINYSMKATNKKLNEFLKNYEI